MPKSRGQGRHRGKGTTRADILLYLLSSAEVLTTRDVKTHFREHYNLQINKNIYVHLKHLEQEGFLTPKTSKGLETEWLLKKDFKTVKAIMHEYPQRPLDLLRTPYFQNMITSDFSAQAVKEFVDATIEHKSFATREHDKKLVQELNTEQFLEIALQNKEFVEFLNSENFAFVFVNPKNSERILHMLHASPSAVQFLCKMDENKKLWSYIISALISIIKPILDHTVYKPLQFKKEHGRVPTKQEVAQLVDTKKFYDEFIARLEKDFFLEKVIESLFVADIFQDNIIETDFVFQYLKDEMNLVTKHETLTP